MSSSTGEAVASATTATAETEPETNSTTASTSSPATPVFSFQPAAASDGGGGGGDGTSPSMLFGNLQRQGSLFRFGAVAPTSTSTTTPATLSFTPTTATTTTTPSFGAATLSPSALTFGAATTSSSPNNNTNNESKRAEATTPTTATSTAVDAAAAASAATPSPEESSPFALFAGPTKSHHHHGSGGRRGGRRRHHHVAPTAATATPGARQKHQAPTSPPQLLFVVPTFRQETEALLNDKNATTATRTMLYALWALQLPPKDEDKKKDDDFEDESDKEKEQEENAEEQEKDKEDKTENEDRDKDEEAKGDEEMEKKDQDKETDENDMEKQEVLDKEKGDEKEDKKDEEDKTTLNDKEKKEDADEDKKEGSDQEKKEDSDQEKKEDGDKDKTPEAKKAEEDKPLSKPPPPPPSASAPLSVRMIWTLLYGHHVCQRKPDEIARCQDSFASTPLHIAAYYGAHVDALQMLLQVYPEAASQKDSRGHTPLQLVFYGAAAMDGTPNIVTSSQPRTTPVIRVQVLEALLQAHPEGVMDETASNEELCPHAAARNEGKSNDGDDDDDENGGKDRKQSLLHLAALSSRFCEEGALDVILRSSPSSARGRDRLGRTPLHILLSPSSSASLSLSPCTELSSHTKNFIGNFLLDAPSAERKALVAMKDLSGRTALHIGANHGVDVDILQLLLDIYPEGTCVPDANGHTPIHLAFLGAAALHSMSGNQVAVKTAKVEALLQSSNGDGAAAKEETKEKHTPLHLAALNVAHCSTSVWDTVFKAHPASALQKDSMGRTPLHILIVTALSGGSSHDAETKARMIRVVHSFLESEDTDVVKIKDLVAAQDANGRMPLHLAADSGADVTLIERFLAIYPEAVSHKDKNGDTPIRLVFLGAGETAAPTTATTTTTPASNPGDENDENKPEAPTPATTRRMVDLKVVQTLLKAYPEAAREVTAKMNQTLLHLVAFKAPFCYPSVFEYVLEANPVAALLRDSTGRTPLHIHASVSLSTSSSSSSLSSSSAFAGLASDGNHVPGQKRSGVRRGRYASQPSDDSDDDQGDDDNEADKCSEHERVLRQMKILLRETQATVTVKGGDNNKNKTTTTITTTTNNNNDGNGTTEGAAAATSCIVATAAAVKDRDGNTPLHTVVFRGDGPIEVIEALLEACPAAVKDRDRRGRLPLHVALSVAQLQPMNRLKRLLEAYPQAVSETDAQGRTPLHVLLEKPFEQVEFFDSLLEGDPGAARIQDSHGRTPLLNVLRWQSTGKFALTIPHVVKAIVEKCPDTVAICDKEKLSPLQCAVERHRDLDVIRQLVEAHPEAVGAYHEGTNSTPLSTVVLQRNDSVTHLLLSHAPQAARTLLKGNVTVLHLAGTWLALRKLFGVWPEAMQVATTSKRRTPLHMWLQGNQFRNATLLAIVQRSLSHPCTQAALRMTDKWGLAPLHYAIVRGVCDSGQFRSNLERCAKLRHFGILMRAYPDPLFMRVPDEPEKKSDDADDDADDNADDDDTNHYDSNAQQALNFFKGTSVIGLTCSFSNCERFLRPLFETLLQSAEAFAAADGEEDDDGDSDDDDDEDDGDDSEDDKKKEETEENEKEGEAAQDSKSSTAEQEERHNGEEERHNGEGAVAEEEADPLAVLVLQKVCEHSNVGGVIPVVEMCHERSSKAIRATTAPPDNRLALHIACGRSDCNLGLIQRLTELYGGALICEDGGGQVPFMTACLQRASIQVLYHLLRSAPDNLLIMEAPEGVAVYDYHDEDDEEENNAAQDDNGDDDDDDENEGGDNDDDDDDGDNDGDNSEEEDLFGDDSF